MRWPVAVHAPSLEILEPAARAVVVAYLEAFRAGLPPAAAARRRADIVAEIGDGLVDDVQARIGRGAPPREAADRAIEEFGDPCRLADAFAEDLAATAARRTGGALILSGPIVGLVWLLAIASTGPLQALHDLWGRVPLYPLVLLVSVPAAVVGHGLPGRPPSTRVALRCALVAGLGCATGDVLLLVAALHAGGALHAGLGVLMLLAVAGSCLRLGLVATAVSRCGRLLTVVA
jgi:hypothetical protein